MALVCLFYSCNKDFVGVTSSPTISESQQLFESWKIKTRNNRVRDRDETAAELTDPKILLWEKATTYHDEKYNQNVIEVPIYQPIKYYFSYNLMDSTIFIPTDSLHFAKRSLLILTNASGERELVVANIFGSSSYFLGGKNLSACNYGSKDSGTA